MKIAVIGIGNVGLALASYLKKKNEVIGVDIINKEVDFPLYQEYECLKDVDIIFISVPTTYNSFLHALDTSILEECISKILAVNKNVSIYIKSTVGVGTTRRLIEIFNYSNIFYTPEFLRQNNALEDINHPSRLVIGSLNKGNPYIKLYFSLFNSDKCFNVTLEEAEAIKLFSNTYLAMRVAFFNELDTFSDINNIDSKVVINAVSEDPRIGNYYNHPSYGYGGYCLPKDSKELASLYKNIPQKLIEAVVLSNDVRKEYIAEEIIKRSPNKIVGIYGKISQYSSLIDIISILNNHKLNVVINIDNYDSISFNKFIDEVDVIISEEKDLDISKFKNKLYVK